MTDSKPPTLSPARPLTNVPKPTFLWLAIAIFGASTAVTRRLTQIGAQHLTEGRNPISLCNVLFVGNLCALMLFVLMHRKQLTWAKLHQLSRNQWTGLVLVALLAGALAPGLIFQALSIASVNNVVLVGRLEPPLTLALSIWLLQEQVNIWQIVGAGVAFVGVFSTILLHHPTTNMVYMGHAGMGVSIGMGELMAAFAALALATATIIGRKRLARVPAGFFSIFRTGLGTVFFFILAKVLYGGRHFMDIASPFLWEWMLLYGAVIVVAGQSFWIAGVRASSIAQASLVASCTPIMGILAAFLILGEAPTLAQYIGGSVILAGLVISHIGAHHQPSRSRTIREERMVPMEQVLGSQIGFKGI